MPMRSIQNWLDAYAESHQNGTNKFIHWICVPSIMLSLLGLFWAIPVPESLALIHPLLNWSTFFILMALIYYVMLSPKLALGMIPVVALMMGINYLIWAQLGSQIWMVAVGIFVLAWIGQFIGHKIEGKKPSFFEDLQFLLIGPLWLLSFIYRKMGLSY
jgi:uncharacterized membrane protein YGL010W